MNTLEKLMDILLREHFPNLVQTYIMPDNCIEVISKTSKNARFSATIPLGYLNTLMEGNADLHNFIAACHDEMTEDVSDIDAYVTSLINEYGGV